MKTKWRVGQWSPQNTYLQGDYLCTDGFNLEILPCGFVMQRQILINLITFVAYMRNLPLNTQKPDYPSQGARKWSLIFAHDSRPIYHAPTYIAVPLLGPHQPWYIESALYYDNIAERSQLWKILFVDNFNMIIAYLMSNWSYIEYFESLWADKIFNSMQTLRLKCYWKLSIICR